MCLRPAPLMLAVILAAAPAVSLRGGGGLAAQSAPVVLEGETLLGGARSTDAAPVRQRMTGFGNAWSGDAQLFWAPQKPGARLALQVSVPSQGVYDVAGAFTRAPDYGQFEIYVNGKQVGGRQDGYARKVVHSGRLALGRATMKAGANTVEIVVPARAAASSGLLVGIDRLEFRRLPSLQRPARASTARANVAAVRYQPVTPYAANVKPIDPGMFALKLVDLRPAMQMKGLPIRNQGVRGTCSVFALTFLLEWNYTAGGKAAAGNLSEEYLNATGDMVAGAHQDGGMFADLNNAYQQYGIVLEATLPYQNTYDPTLTLPAALLKSGKAWPRQKAVFIRTWDNTTGATTAELEHAIAYLDKGLPVAAGMWWPKKGYFATQPTLGVDVMFVPSPSQKMSMLTDGHSVALVGYARSPMFPGGGFFVFRNSWGTSFGDNGYGYVPFAYVTRFANDLLAYEP